jgi:hypothetical protein
MIAMRTGLLFGSMVAALLVTSTALAEDGKDSGASSSWTPSSHARALEITTGSGFSQGFGEISKGGKKMSDIASSGFAPQLGLGYRIDPRWMVGVYVEGALYRPDRGSLSDRRVFGAAAGIQANYHFLPFARLDPWIGLGGGWRGNWVDDSDAPTASLQGLDLARLQIGADYHFSRSFVLGPAIGASVTEFISQKEPLQSSFRSVTDPRPVTFLFIGTTARFDLGGKLVAPSLAVASR